MDIAGKKILITGGAGFIGSHLVDRLLKINCRVTVLDDKSNGDKNNLLEASKNKRFQFIHGTVVNEKLVKKILKDRYYAIFHLASGNLLTSLKNPKHDLKVSGLGTLNLLETLRKNKQETILIFSSTGSIYGEPKYAPQDEKHPLNTLSPYGISKLAADKYVQLWSELFNIPTVALRYYNVYGPRQRFHNEGGVVGIFINRILHNQPPIIEGTGKQERCFTYVSDVVEANILAAETRQSWGEAFNIASSEITSIKRLAKIILYYLNSNLRPLSAPRRVGDIDSFQPDISKAKTILNYSPKVNLTQGIKNTVDWFRKV